MENELNQTIQVLKKRKPYLIIGGYEKMIMLATLMIAEECKTTQQKKKINVMYLFTFLFGVAIAWLLTFIK